MTVVLGLLAALAYGTSDFAAGLDSRRFAAGPVTGVALALGALLFIALDRAGTRAGAWPPVPGQVVALLPL